MRIIRCAAAAAAAAALVGSSLIAASARAQSAGQPDAGAHGAGAGPAAGDAGVTAPQGPPHALSAVDRKFLRDAYGAATADLSLGRLASQKGTTRRVKQVGHRLVAGAARQQADLETLASQSGLELPTQPGKEDQATLSQLSGLTGRAFDRQVLIAVRGHEEALLGQLQHQRNEGTNPDLTAYAKREMATVRAQLAATRGLGVTAQKKKHGGSP
jgi:putative membrane protein